MSILRRVNAVVARSAVCLAVVACGEARAWGQPLGEHLDSIEWMVADSSLIVRGTIIGLETETKDSSLWRTVTFRVDETLKGEHRPTLRFIVWTNTVEKEVDRWKDQGLPLLAFLDESRCAVAQFRQPEYGRFPFAPRHGDRKLSFIALDPKGAGPAYTLDLRALTSPEEILRATRAALAMPPEPGRRCSSWLRFPGHGDLLRVTVPIDSRLEAKAGEWVRSEVKDLRREGAKALMFYRSDANASIFKGLLDDPNSWNATTQERGVEHHFRWYWVREEAYDVLVAWGYDVPRPVLKEDLPAAPDRLSRGERRAAGIRLQTSGRPDQYRKIANP